MCIPFTILAILYGIFVLKEVEPKPKTAEEKGGVDNPGFDNTTGDGTVQVNESQNRNQANGKTPKKKSNCLIDFFNPIVILQCIQVILRKRENKGRIVLWLLFCIFLLSVTNNAESLLEFGYVRVQLNWDAALHSNFRSYALLMGIIASFIMVTIFGKQLKIPDPLLAVIGIIFSIVGKFIYVS